MTGRLRSLLLSLGAVYAAACAYLYTAQGSMLYYPTPEVQSPGAQAFTLHSDGETLKIWRVAEGRSRAMFYFGGNAEQVAWNIPEFQRRFPQHTIYLANYRGYGGSTGRPSEQGLLHDAVNLYDAVRDAHREFVVIGRSLGSGVAVHLASQRKVDRLVLVTPFDSVENVAKALYPLFPVSWLLRDKFDSKSRVKSISASTLIITAENDEIIPSQNSRALATEFSSDRVKEKIIRNATHNSIDQFPEYLESIAGFIAVP